MCSPKLGFRGWISNWKWSCSGAIFGNFSFCGVTRIWSESQDPAWNFYKSADWIGRRCCCDDIFNLGLQKIIRFPSNNGPLLASSWGAGFWNTCLEPLVLYQIVVIQLGVWTIQFPILNLGGQHFRNSFAACESQRSCDWWFLIIGPAKTNLVLGNSV